jgi:hypothetical protein
MNNQTNWFKTLGFPLSGAVMAVCLLANAAVAGGGRGTVQCRPPSHGPQVGQDNGPCQDLATREEIYR